MTFRLRIAVLLSVAAGILAQPAIEASRAHASLVELKTRAAAKRSGEKKSDGKNQPAKSGRGAAAGNPVAMLSPDSGAGKAGGGLQKSFAVSCSAVVCAEFAHAAERGSVVVGIDEDFGRLHWPSHFALAPPRASRQS